MSRKLLLAIASVICFSACADGDDSVLTELSRRSGLPASQLEIFLADCDANQQSMYFCAYRDLVRSELGLKDVIETKKRSLNSCASAVEQRASERIQKRNSDCEQSAKNEWGGGSMEATARAICMVKQTDQIADQLKKTERCSSL